MSDHVIGDLAEVLDNLGVFGAHPDDLAELCPTGFRRIAIQTGPDYYISLQAFGPNQTAYAHTHPDSEEWSSSSAATARPTSARLRCRSIPASLSAAAEATRTGSGPRTSRCTC